MLIGNRLSWNVFEEYKQARVLFCFAFYRFPLLNKTDLFVFARNLLDIELFLSFCALGQRSLWPPVSHAIEPLPHGATLSPSDFQARS